MTSPSSFGVQQQTRQNATEMYDYLNDLKSWKKDMEKDNKQPSEISNDDIKSTNDIKLPPIRNRSFIPKKSKAYSPKIIKNIEDIEDNSKIDAIKFKTKGNDFFKRKEFKKAIDCYTSAIDIQPKNAILFCNRAIANLKLEDFKSAEIDCNLGLKLHSKKATKMKIYFRRGLARKSLLKYKQSIADFKKVLNIDGKNRAAKNELRMVNKILSKEKKMKIMKHKKNKNESRKIVIEEVEDDSSDNDDILVQSEIKTKMVENVIESDFKNDEYKKVSEIKVNDFSVKSIPENFLQFEKLWSRANGRAEYRAIILCSISGSNWMKIFANMMDDELFSQIIDGIHHVCQVMGDGKCAVLLLEKLSKIDRFEMIAMFMNEDDRKLLSEMRNSCQLKGLKSLSVFEKFQ